MASDKERLMRALAKELGWDLGTLDGIVEAVEAASGQSEVDEIVQDYLGGSAAVKQFVQQFLVARRSAHAPQSASGAGTSQARQAAPARQGQRQAGSVTVMHKAKKGAAAPSPGPPRPERPVVNCLCCGKIYRTRDDSADVAHFIELGGACTFCGAKVALAHGAHSEERPPPAERRAGRGAAAGSSASAGRNVVAIEKGAEAVAFKDRLVEYDRNSAQRTQVLDDQSDFFEVDANAWLTHEEREALKAQERAAQEAEEARRRRVVVTLDLLGRQVLMAEDAQPSGAAQEAAQLAGVAARDTAAQAPQGGGSSARAALQAAGLLQGGAPALRMRPAPHDDPFELGLQDLAVA
ncbi:hypothetical protein WJX81_003659 [Elliptochloris bilobata]|uniref:Activating signal cointegrator 1 third domain-containing protein n=1 Tax=Elliptochloris bilobata TaxID=381761 RepID=A0AAW1QY63_9CHLO